MIGRSLCDGSAASVALHHAWRAELKVVSLLDMDDAAIDGSKGCRKGRAGGLSMADRTWPQCQ